VLASCNIGSEEFMTRFSVAAVAPFLVVASTLHAAVYAEIGDAGQTLGTAQIAATGVPGPLTDITGFLEPGGADLFRIFLTGGKTFSATTTQPASANFFDMQLFLFDSAGLGVYANDDDPSSPPQSTLPSGITFTPAASGTYYLAISGTGFMPVSAGGFIFPVSGGLLDQTGGILNAVGPSGPGGGSPLTGWSSVSSETGNYDIALTGVQSFAPEPMAFWLFGGGLAALALRRHVRRNG
jgi:hypothetical protein